MSLDRSTVAAPHVNDEENSTRHLYIPKKQDIGAIFLYPAFWKTYTTPHHLSNCRWCGGYLYIAIYCHFLIK